MNTFGALASRTEIATQFPVIENKQSLPTVLRIDNINEVSSALSRLASKRIEKPSYPDEKIPIIQYENPKDIDDIILGISPKKEEEDKEWRSKLAQRFQRSSSLKVTEVTPEIVISMDELNQNSVTIFPKQKFSEQISHIYEETAPKRKHFTRRTNKIPLDEKGFGLELFEPTD